MKAIKERAKVYGSKGKTNLNKYHREKSYIEIATEQKTIDDELLKRVHKGVIRKAIREKKEVAMKAYCKRCQDMGGGYPCSHKCYEYIEYAKTLEE